MTYVHQILRGAWGGRPHCEGHRRRRGARGRLPRGQVRRPHCEGRRRLKQKKMLFQKHKFSYKYVNLIYDAYTIEYLTYVFTYSI